MNSNRSSTALPALALAVAVVALAGCSGAGKSTVLSPVARRSINSAAAKPLAMMDVAAKIGCSGVQRANLPLGTTAATVCSRDGHDVYLYTFVSDTARDRWLKVAKRGGALGTFQQGKSWVAQTV